HHHGGEAVLDGGDAGGKVVAVVEVHANGNVWIHFRKPVDQARKYAIARIGARAAARLDDDRGSRGGGGGHDRQPLLHVGDVERRNGVAVFGCMIEKLAKRYSCHGCLVPALLETVRGVSLTAF